MNAKHIYKTKEDLATAFAKYLVGEINASETFHLALSGGSTPKILFDCLAKDYADKVDWSKLHLFWGDERCVEPWDEQSNFGMTKQRLLDHINIPDENIHRVRGENNPSKEALRYSQDIEDTLAGKNGMPTFDMVILGMGGDGHTASIFPHEMELWNDPKTCVLATHPESGQQRISITGDIINAAKQVHFLVTGDSKREVLKSIFSQTRDYKSYPANYVLDAEWWMDEAAFPKV